MAYVEFDPHADAPDGTDAGSWLEEQGWSEFLGIGDEQTDLRFRSWRRQIDGRWEYACEVWDVIQGSPFLKIESFGELMDIMARWAPALQAAAVIGFLERAQTFGLDTDGEVEKIAAKVAFGSTAGLAAVQKQMKIQADRQREIREQRQPRSQ